MRPPRVLVVCPIIASKLYAFDLWVEALNAQETELLWDVLIIDNTDAPHPGYVDWLNTWVKSKPFGSKHRVRMMRFGKDVDGQQFKNPLYKVQWAERMAWDKLQKWTSYDYMWSLEIDVIPNPTDLQELYEADLPWAAAWMVSRQMFDPGKQIMQSFPLIWHSLTVENYSKAKKWSDISKLGYLDPPTQEPFECVVTHMGSTLIRRDLIEKVPFRLTSVGGDVYLSWAAAEHGFPVTCVPSVAPRHLSEFEV